MIIIAIIIIYVINNFLKKSQEQSFLIIGIDFGSSFSGYSILTDRKFDFEEHDKNKIFYSEIILDKETKIGKKIRKGNDNSILNLDNKATLFCKAALKIRRRRDSNPRCKLSPHNFLAGSRFQPLSHFSMYL